MHDTLGIRRRAGLLLVLLGLSLGLVSPAIAQEGSSDSQNLFLWKATSGSRTIYLLGSIHLVPPDTYPLAEEIEQAYERSQALAVEFDITNVDQGLIQKLVLEKGMYPAGDDLSKHARKESLELLEPIAEKMGIPIDVLMKFRPWMLTLMVGVMEVETKGFSAEVGIDKHFLDKAGAAKKRIVELETAEEQVDLLSSLSPELQEMVLFQTLSHLSVVSESAKDLLGAWKTGDEAAMEKAIEADRNHENEELKTYYAKLLDERNSRMAQRIDEHADKDAILFVVVGAGHLVGDRGIVNLLKARNFEVVQVKRGRRSAAASK